MRFNFLAALILGAAFFIGGCSKQSSSSPITTGKVIQAGEVWQAVPQGPMPFTPDLGYAVVNDAWLDGFYARFRSDLFAKDVTKWEGRFDCNKFAAYYCALAQAEFYRDTFHSWIPGQALAVGEVWYVPGWSPGKGHAIVVAVTDRGAVFIEPQTGKRVALTDAERSSIYFKRF